MARIVDAEIKRLKTEVSIERLIESSPIGLFQPTLTMKYPEWHHHRQCH